MTMPAWQYHEPDQSVLEIGAGTDEFLPGGFLTYQHQGPPLDAVVTQIALHHLPDFWKQIALLRIFDMLKEGGKDREGRL